MLIGNTKLWHLRNCLNLNLHWLVRGVFFRLCLFLFFLSLWSRGLSLSALLSLPLGRFLFSGCLSCLFLFFGLICRHWNLLCLLLLHVCDSSIVGAIIDNLDLPYHLSWRLLLAWALLLLFLLIVYLLWLLCSNLRLFLRLFI